LPRSAGIDPPFAKLIPNSWFAKVVMSERSPEQITLIRLLGDFDLAEEWSTRQSATMVDFDGRNGVRRKDPMKMQRQPLG
jgi:hypothetical protein